MGDERIVIEGGVGEIEEKKSRFIATVRPVSTEEEALAVIAALKKKYWDARHNCFAYIVGEHGRLMRCSDDGEPQGTAGRPILDVMTGRHICGAVIVVTRYFGGVLLGTGGLVRAYSAAAAAGLDASKVLKRREGEELWIRLDYTDLGKVQYLLGQRGIQPLDSLYEENVRLRVVAGTEEMRELLQAVTEGTAGRAQYLERRTVIFAEGDAETILMDEH